MSRQKQKGTAWETAIVNWLHAAGFKKAHRPAPAGVNDCGDVAGLWGIVIEAKNHKTMDLARWVDEAEVERRNADAAVAVVWHKRRGRAGAGGGYVTMTGEDFTTLLKTSAVAALARVEGT